MKRALQLLLQYDIIKPRVGSIVPGRPLASISMTPTVGRRSTFAASILPSLMQGMNEFEAFWKVEPLTFFFGVVASMHTTLIMHSNKIHSSAHVTPTS